MDDGVLGTQPSIGNLFICDLDFDRGIRVNICRRLDLKVSAVLDLLHLVRQEMETCFVGRRMRPVRYFLDLLEVFDFRGVFILPHLCLSNCKLARNHIDRVKLMLLTS